MKHGRLTFRQKEQEKRKINELWNEFTALINESPQIEYLEQHRWNAFVKHEYGDVYIGGSNFIRTSNWLTRCISTLSHSRPVNITGGQLTPRRWYFSPIRKPEVNVNKELIMKSHIIRAIEAQRD